MVVLGLVLVVVAVLLVLAGLFTAGIDAEVGSDDRIDATTEVLGLNMPPEAIFIIGVVAGLLAVLGAWLMTAGAKSGWRRRREHKHYEELQGKLDRVEAERRADERDERR